MNGKRAWAVIAGWVVIYNGFLAKDGDLLSEQVDEWLKGPVLVRATTLATILALAAHLANAVNPQRDPISILFGFMRRVSGRVA